MAKQFLCIGFQKCGTTTMYDILKQHPGVALTQDVKEPMYYRVLGADKLGGGKEWYDKRYFGYLSPDDKRMRGEVNAGLAFTGCAEKIGRDFPKDTKIFFMMRNPADRAYSAYKYFLAQGFLPQFVLADDRANGHAAAFHRYVRFVLGDAGRRGEIMEKRLKYLVFSQGNYYTSVKEYLSYFPKENMHFILFEDFIKDQEGTCKDLYHFLGISEDADIHYGIKSNEGTLRASGLVGSKVGIADMGLHYLEYEFLDLSRRTPHLFKALDTVHNAIQKQVIVEETDFSKMLPQTRRILEHYYDPQVRGMEKLMGRSLREKWY